MTDRARDFGPKECSRCGDAEPSHVHDETDDRIEDYFTVGRGEDDMTAARRWQGRAVAAERELAELVRAASDYADSTHGISGDLGARLTDAQNLLRTRREAR